MSSKAWDTPKTITRLRDNSGHLHDPRIVAEFLDMNQNGRAHLTGKGPGRTSAKRFIRAVDPMLSLRSTDSPAPVTAAPKRLFGRPCETSVNTEPVPERCCLSRADS